MKKRRRRGDDADQFVDEMVKYLEGDERFESMLKWLDNHKIRKNIWMNQLYDAWRQNDHKQFLLECLKVFRDTGKLY